MPLSQTFRDANLVPGQTLGALSQTVLLSADGQAILPGYCTLILLQSNDTTAANRTFTLDSSSVVGHQITLILTSGSSTTCQMADSGNAKLSAAWEPLQYDTLTLVSDGTNWIEVCRADN